MSKTLAMTGCLVMAAVAWGAQLVAQSQPVPEGLRRTSEVAAEGTRAAAQGTRNTINRAADATRNTVDSTTEAARARIDRNARNEIQTNGGASADGYNGINAGARVDVGQAQADANLNTNQNQLQADSRLDNQTFNPTGQYESGYRGKDEGNLSAGPVASQSDQVEYNGRAYTLRHDSQGREFICVCGRPVYFGSSEQGQQTRGAYKMPTDSMNHDRMNQDGIQQERMPSDLNQSDRSDYRPQSGYGPVPAPPDPIRTDAADVSPAGPTLSTEAESSADLPSDADIDTEANADVDASSSSSEATEEAREVEDKLDRDASDSETTN